VRVLQQKESAVTVKIIANDKGNPAGKLADAELHFLSGPLEGLKLIGFSVWERKTGNGRNVTFPARTYSVNGERRSFALLRPIGDTTAQNRVRDLVLQAYAEFETEAALASAG
jgi:hypothetical protein